MRLALSLSALMLVGSAASLGAWARPATIVVSSPHPASKLYGPAEMLCDLHTCRLFNLPASVVPQPNTIVEFGMPTLSGQDRVDLRRCFQLCRASVLGWEAGPAHDAKSSQPTINITPIELRLE